MSKGRFTSRREAAIKQLRAKAHKEQTTFRAAVGEYSSIDVKRLGLYKPCCPICAGTVGLDVSRVHSNARKQARRGGIKDDAPVFMGSCGGPCSICEDTLASIASPSRIDEAIQVSLTEVKTKRAKAKGVRKEYEVIESASKRVIALDDFEERTGSVSGFGDEEDWEHVDDETAVVGARPNYASVVRGG